MILYPILLFDKPYISSYPKQDLNLKNIINKIHWLSWSRMARSKSEGGIGWRVLVNPDSL